MKKALPWFAPLALVPLVLIGLEAWREQATWIWLSGFVASCF